MAIKIKTKVFSGAWALASTPDLTHPLMECGTCKEGTQLPSPTTAGSHPHCPTGFVIFHSCQLCPPASLEQPGRHTLPSVSHPTEPPYKSSKMGCDSVDRCSPAKHPERYMDPDKTYSSRYK